MLNDRHIVVREEKRKITVRDNGSVRIVEVARQGPPGGQGEPGVAEDFEQEFSSPAMTWTVNHNLGRKPLVSVLTVGNFEMEAQIGHTNNNQFVVYFATPMTGRVRCL